MSLFRTSALLSSGFLRRAAPLSARQTLARPISSTTPRSATQGYGDGKGDPKGENPQDQGASNATKQQAEHPGPEPPKEGQGTGAGPTKGGSGKSPEDASAHSGGARSKEATETGNSPTGGSIEGAPKISDKSEPGSENSASKQAEVDQHNKEFEKRHDRAQPAAEDKVDKKFWSGQGGKDSQP